MTKEQSKYYINTMKTKSLAYAEDVLSDVKAFMPNDEYQEAVRDFAQAFLCGGDAAIDILKDILKIKKE